MMASSLRYHFNTFGGFHTLGYPKCLDFVMESPTKMDDLGVPLFQETTISRISISTTRAAIARRRWSQMQSPTTWSSKLWQRLNLFCLCIEEMKSYEICLASLGWCSMQFCPTTWFPGKTTRNPVPWGKKKFGRCSFKPIDSIRSGTAQRIFGDQHDVQRLANIADTLSFACWWTDLLEAGNDKTLHDKERLQTRSR